MNLPDFLRSSSQRLKVALRSPKVLATMGVSLAIIILVAYSFVGYIKQRHRSETPTSTPRQTQTKPTDLSPAPPSPKPETPQAASYLNGRMVEAGTENIHPLAVMIENHPEARPQAGLGAADLVYEAIAEGGITRFMAVFANPKISVKVGPIRSARTYYVDLATELHAFYAHVGGNMDALDQIRNTSVLNLDQFSIGEPVFQRDFSRAVAYEHTMYSSTDKLWKYATEVNHWSTTGDFGKWIFQDDTPLEQRPASQVVSVEVSDPLYAVIWNYDKPSNTYLRSMAGSPHIDSNTNKQISAKTIILEQVERQETTTRINEHGWIYTLTGSGPATIIQNGTVQKATWKKQGTERTRYFDQSGKEISLVRGTIWVHLIHSDSTISY